MRNLHPCDMCKMRCKYQQNRSITFILRSTPDRRQSKMLILSTRSTSKIIRNRVFDCHLASDWRQMTIENTYSSAFNPRSSIVKIVFDCRLSGVINMHPEEETQNTNSHSLNLFNDKLFLRTCLNTCADLESFVREGPTLTSFFFLFFFF